MTDSNHNLPVALNILGRNSICWRNQLYSCHRRMVNIATVIDLFHENDSAHALGHPYA